MNPPDKPVTSAIPSPNPALASSASGQQLKLINTGTSADGRHIHLHFITSDNRVTTIQLETAVAAAFHARLGETLSSIGSNAVRLGRIN